MAKRRMCELTTLWKDRSIPVALKMRLVKTLVWTVLSYGAEAWTLKARDERMITSMEMWLWRRMLRISWMEKRTDNSILQELEIKRELLGHVRKRKLSYYGHLCRDHGCQITKTVVEGYVEGRRRRGRPRKQYIDNIKQWTQLTTSECVRAAEDRSRWKQLISQAMVADDHTWSAEKKKNLPSGNVFDSIWRRFGGVAYRLVVDVLVSSPSAKPASTQSQYYIPDSWGLFLQQIL